MPQAKTSLQMFQELLHRPLLKSQEAQFQLGKNSSDWDLITKSTNGMFRSMLFSQISNVKVSFEALSSPGNSSTETTTGAAAAQNLNSEFVSIYELTKVWTVNYRDLAISNPKLQLGSSYWFGPLGMLRLVLTDWIAVSLNGAIL